jgi:hypothetical protein
LRRHTATRRSDRRGGAKRISHAQVAPGELEEDVFEVGRPVQAAQAGLVGQVGEQRGGVVGVAEGGLAAHLAALAQRVGVGGGPGGGAFALPFAEDLDHLRLDVGGDDLRGLPWARMRPASMMASRLARRSASSMKWVVSRMVVPSAVRRRRRSQIRWRAWGSRPVVGSSRISSSGG